MGKFYTPGEIDPYLDIERMSEGAQVINQPRAFFAQEEVAGVLATKNIRDLEGIDMYVTTPKGLVANRISVANDAITLHPGLQNGSTHIASNRGTLMHSPDSPAHNFLYAKVSKTDVPKAVEIFMNHKDGLCFNNSLMVNQDGLIALGLHDRTNFVPIKNYAMSGVNHLPNLQKAFDKAGIRIQPYELGEFNTVEGTALRITGEKPAGFPEELTMQGYERQLQKLSVKDVDNFNTPEYFKQEKALFEANKAKAGIKPRSLSDASKGVAGALNKATNAAHMGTDAAAAARFGTSVRRVGETFTSAEDLARMAKAAKAGRLLK